MRNEFIVPVTIRKEIFNITVREQNSILCVFSISFNLYLLNSLFFFAYFSN